MAMTPPPKASWLPKMKQEAELRAMQRGSPHFLGAAPQPTYDHPELPIV